MWRITYFRPDNIYLVDKDGGKDTKKKITSYPCTSLFGIDKVTEEWATLDRALERKNELKQNHEVNMVRLERIRKH